MEENREYQDYINVCVCVIYHILFYFIWFNYDRLHTHTHNFSWKKIEKTMNLKPLV